jgi:hypothetical protein
MITAKEQIQKILREYLASESYKNLNSVTTSCQAVQKNIQDFCGDQARVEVTPGWDENTFDVAVYPVHPVDYISIEFTVERKDEVSDPIEEQQS